VTALVVALAIAGVVIVEKAPWTSSALGGENTASLTGATASAATRAAIVAQARSQVGYTTDPSTTYCNKYSAYWFAGTSDCGNTNRDEQWCADFAAWVWRMAGVPLVYRFVNGDINSSSASFYEWGLRHHTWHPVGSRYVPQPGDVAIYGLNTTTLIAQHVAVVVSDTPGSAGPNAINGDGDHTGFSRVEYQGDEYNADASGTGSAVLAGYVAPSA
jgi:hypothetical protein